MSKTLLQILGREGFEYFMANKFSRMPLAIPNGAQNYKTLLDWDIIDGIIEKGQSPLRIVKNGKMIKDYAKMQFMEAKKYYQEGHTLLIKNAEKSDEDLNEIAKDFSSYFKTEVDVQLYCTPDKHNAFGWHYDVEEVFILQIEGSKHYTIRPNTVHPNPLIKSIPKDLEYEKENSNLEVRVVMKEGDFLYIPSGWWHVAQTQVESMHISIGLMPVSAIKILEHLPLYLTQNLFWRTRLPIHQNFNSNSDKINFYKNAFAILAKDIESHMKSDEFIFDFLNHYSRNSEP